jgi:hypothetical protein
MAQFQSTSVTGSLTVTGQVVAQTLNVQQVTSSIVYSSGSNIFGNSLGNTQQFTGSVSVTGSLTVNGVMSLNNDGTYGSTYKTLGLTGNTNGSHRIFAGTSDDMFFAAATGRGLDFRVSGSANTSLYIASTGAATFSGPTVTIGNAVAATNVKLIFNGVASKAAGIEFHQSGTPQWYIGNGIASEDNNFELYNSNGTMAMKIIKSTNAINFIGNVGLGLASPTGQLSIKNQISNGSTPVSSYAATNGVDGQNFLNGYYAVNSDGLGSYPRYLDIVSVGSPDGSNGGSNIRFFTNPIANNSPAVERMRITSDGYVRLTTSSGGIQFNGDTAAANALDDYEEGTWNLGVRFAASTVGITYSSQGGTYTKIGRQVTVNGFFTLSNKGAAVGQAVLTGLPFTSGNTTGNYTAATLRINSVSSTGTAMGLLNINDTTIGMESVTAAGVLTDITNANFANNSTVILSLSYFV